jgi:hypothetical protein
LVPVKLQVLLHVSRFDAHLSLPSLTQPMEGALFSLRGLDAKLRINLADVLPFQGGVHFDDLRYRSTGSKPFGFDLKYVDYRFALAGTAFAPGGRHALTVEAYSDQMPGGVQHRIQGVWLYVNQTVDEDASDWSLLFHANRYAVGSEVSGPYHLEAVLSGLNNQAVRKAQAVWVQNPQLNAQAFRAMLTPGSALLKLCTHGFQLHLKGFSMNTPQGDVHASGHWVLEAQGTPTLQAVLTSSHMQWVARLPAAWLLDRLRVFYASNMPSDAGVSAQSMASKQIQSWVEARYLLPDQTDYRINLQYNHGLFSVNPSPDDALVFRHRYFHAIPRGNGSAERWHSMNG